jgi:hypothetical protein
MNNKRLTTPTEDIAGTFLFVAVALIGAALIGAYVLFAA